MLGCGNVGAAFVELVADQAKEIEARTGVDLDVTRVAVRNLSRDRDVELDPGVLTRDAHDVVADPDIDLVVEVIGGIEPARELITHRARRRQAGRHRQQGAARQRRCRAVPGRPTRRRRPALRGRRRRRHPARAGLRESLRGEPIRRVIGIVNGTTNFILTKMTEEGADVRRRARRGAAPRASPSATRRPTSRASTPAPRRRSSPRSRSAPEVVAGDVYHEGISELTPADIDVARRLGYVVKLLGDRRARRATGEIAVRVHPAMVPVHHPLASVRESFNAVFVEGDAVGSLMFYGRGAGGLPTASAVLGDVIDAAVNLTKGTHGTLGTFAKARIRPIDETSAEYLLGLEVADRAGRAARRHRRVRRPRREHPRRRAGGHRSRRPPRVHHPRGQGVGRAGDRPRPARARRRAPRRRRCSAVIGS